MQRSRWEWWNEEAIIYGRVLDEAVSLVSSRLKLAGDEQDAAYVINDLQRLRELLTDCEATMSEMQKVLKGQEPRGHLPTPGEVAQAMEKAKANMPELLGQTRGPPQSQQAAWRPQAPPPAQPQYPQTPPPAPYGPPPPSNPF